MKRDYQKNRLYSAERDALCGDVPYQLRFGTRDLAGVRKRAKDILRSKWWRKRSPVVELKIGLTRGDNLCYRWSDTAGILAINTVNTPQEHVLIHEMAHLLVDHVQLPGHGKEFAGIYLEMIRTFVGKVAGDRLEATFLKHGVKYNPKVSTPLTET